jgi:CRP-like cAMP-binding protein
MIGYNVPRDLQSVLQGCCEKIRKPKSTVLFRRGEEATGMFVILQGRVSLDFGVDAVFARSYGPGALVGLPATVTKRPYSMTATVTEDAELGCWSSEALDSLLRERPDLCRQLLSILGERVAENQQITKAILDHAPQPQQRSGVV